MSTSSPIAETARLEAATETLAEYIGYLSGEIDVEQEQATPNTDRIKAIEHELTIVSGLTVVVSGCDASLGTAGAVHSPIEVSCQVKSPGVVSRSLPELAR